MNKEFSVDLVGLGKVAKAIPPASIKRIVETACVTFEQVVAPITATTAGLGRYLTAKFDKLEELEKINAADAFRLAYEKLEQIGSSSPLEKASPKLLAAALSGSAQESDPSLREMWANLIAREFVEGGVHPMFLRILEQLSPADASGLVLMCDYEKKWQMKGIEVESPLSNEMEEEELKRQLGVSQFALTSYGLVNLTFYRLAHSRLNPLTELGRAFMTAVQAPEKKTPSNPEEPD